MVVKHLFALMMTMDNDDGNRMHQVLAAVFADPLRFIEKFSHIKTEVADTDEDEGAQAEAPAAEAVFDSPLGSLCQGLSKAGHFSCKNISRV